MYITFISVFVSFFVHNLSKFFEKKVIIKKEKWKYLLNNLGGFHLENYKGGEHDGSDRR